GHAVGAQLVGLLEQRHRSLGLAGLDQAITLADQALVALRAAHRLGARWLGARRRRVHRLRAHRPLWPGRLGHGGGLAGGSLLLLVLFGLFDLGGRRRRRGLGLDRRRLG